MKTISLIHTNKRDTSFLVIFLYLIIINLVYILSISPLYGYAGFITDIKLYKVLISFFLLFIIHKSFPKKNVDISNRVLELHFIIMIIPLLSMFSMANKSTAFTLMVVFCFLLQIVLIRFLPKFKIRAIKGGHSITYFIIGAISLITYAYLFSTQKINTSAFDFSTIYEIRSERKVNSTISYLITWQYRIINPFLLIYTLLRKKYLFFYIVLFIQIITYLIYPNKEIILSIILIGFTYFITKKNKNFSSIFIKILMVAMVVSFLVAFFFSDITLLSIIPHRMLNVSALMKFEHFDFFSIHEKLYYSEGLVGKLLNIDYKYKVPSGMLINDGLWGNANTGYIAYAYSNSGFFGMILMSLLFVFVLKLIDSLVKNNNKGIVFSILIYPMFVLNDGDLLTLLLTGGLFLLFIILITIDLNDNDDLKYEKNWNHKKI